MNDMTAENLRSAYGGESQAHMRYRIWAESAKKEGFPVVERLFMATSDAEEVHATLHFKALKEESGDYPVTSMGGFGLSNTSDHLQAAIDGEVFEYEQMYPAYIEVAKMQGEDEAVRSMRFAIEAEKVHAELFTKAKKAVDAGNDLEAEVVDLCPVCGYIALNEEEDACPLCKAKRAVFVSY